MYCNLGQYKILFGINRQVENATSVNDTTINYTKQRICIKQAWVQNKPIGHRNYQYRQTDTFYGKSKTTESAIEHISC